MITIRYTQWDGSQRVRLNADQVFEKLSEYLSYTDDVQQALEWLMRQGAEWDGMRVMGLDDFLEEVREQLRQRYREFNLNNSLDEIRQRLEDLLDLERDTLRGTARRAAVHCRRSSISSTACRTASPRPSSGCSSTSSKMSRRARSSRICSRNCRT